MDYNDRKVKAIRTDLSRQQNLLLIEKIASENSWRVDTNKLNYKEHIIPFMFWQSGNELNKKLKFI